jgi:hypothetical protein
MKKSEREWERRTLFEKFGGVQVMFAREYLLENVTCSPGCNFVM